MASGHESLIIIVEFVLVGSMGLHCRFYPCCRADLEIKYLSDFYFGAVKLINSMFLLHVFHYSSCLIFSSVETRSLEEHLEETTENENQRHNIGF